MYALITPTQRVLSLHATRIAMESAFGRYMANSLHWPFGPEVVPQLVELHTTRYVGDFVPYDEFTTLPASRENKTTKSQENNGQTPDRALYSPERMGGLNSIANTRPCNLDYSQNTAAPHQGVVHQGIFVPWL